ncbi:MAG: CcoQ/FixQ family Cbb3-type cytochrome c oxidase assembly chaperone [Nitrospirae bacterium]|nr:MAG: CcoQ/FixQ family Cbb3-type cytochrome c oxidase assembly chaperone [Nitrospirota bacterium]
MVWSGWINFIFTFALFVVFLVVVFHYYNPRKKKEDKEHVEKPKYKMLEDDDK